jgi:hypothetical protein
MKNLVPVEGSTSLARDTRSKAIVNINKSEVDQARARKTARRALENERIAAREQVDEMQIRIDRIDHKLNLILEKML